MVSTLTNARNWIFGCLTAKGCECQLALQKPAKSRKLTRNLCDRFDIQDQGRERPVLTLLTDSLGHYVDGYERLLNRGELDHRKADCQEHPQTALWSHSRPKLQ